MSHVLGVDGGGTKTVALVARADGSVVGRGRGPGGTIYDTVPPDRGLRCIEQAAAAALRSAAVGREELAAAAFSVSGADWPEDNAYLRSSLASRGLGRTIVVVNDALGALWAGAPDGVGVAVVCGTGAATGARASGGAVWHSGHWQEPQGSLHLAEQALRAVYRAELGLQPATTLTSRVLDIFDVPAVEDVLHVRTARLPEPPRDLGPVARALLEEAAGGDEVARDIVVEHGRALGDYAVVAARRVGLLGDRFPLVLAGGVLRAPQTLLGESIIARVAEAGPLAFAVRPSLDPVVGAVVLALEASGVAVDGAVRSRLQATAYVLRD